MQLTECRVGGCKQQKCSGSVPSAGDKIQWGSLSSATARQLQSWNVGASRLHHLCTSQVGMDTMGGPECIPVRWHLHPAAASQHLANKLKEKVCEGQHLQPGVVQEADASARTHASDWQSGIVRWPARLTSGCCNRCREA